MTDATVTTFLTSTTLARWLPTKVNDWRRAVGGNHEEGQIRGVLATNSPVPLRSVRPRSTRLTMTGPVGAGRRLPRLRGARGRTRAASPSNYAGLGLILVDDCLRGNY